MMVSHALLIVGQTYMGYKAHDATIVHPFVPISPPLFLLALTEQCATANPIVSEASGSKSANDMYNITPALKLSMTPNLGHDGWPLNATMAPPRHVQ
jgi:hypothetical protein